MVFSLTLEYSKRHKNTFIIGKFEVYNILYCIQSSTLNATIFSVISKF